MDIKTSASDAVVTEASNVLSSSGIVGFPTETFYGLGVRHDDPTAIARLFALKGRPTVKAVPLIIGSLDILDTLVQDVSPEAEALIKAHWPGPLTLVFNASTGLHPLIAPKGKVAVRIPGESFALTLARAFNAAITATSANPSGQPAAANASAVSRYFPSGVDLLIDGGSTPGGLPSTIVDTTVSPPSILRIGACRL
jgi:L-threonylcarbamoyladenylate synthase